MNNILAVDTDFSVYQGRFCQAAGCVNLQLQGRKLCQAVVFEHLKAVVFFISFLANTCVKVLIYTYNLLIYTVYSAKFLVFNDRKVLIYTKPRRYSPIQRIFGLFINYFFNFTDFIKKRIEVPKFIKKLRSRLFT